MTAIDDALPDQAIDAVLASIDDTSGSSGAPAIMANVTEPEPVHTDDIDLVNAIAAHVIAMRRVQPHLEAA